MTSYFCILFYESMLISIPSPHTFDLFWRSAYCRTASAFALASTDMSAYLKYIISPWNILPHGTSFVPYHLDYIFFPHERIFSSNPEDLQSMAICSIDCQYIQFTVVSINWNQNFCYWYKKRKRIAATANHRLFSYKM